MSRRVLTKTHLRALFGLAGGDDGSGDILRREGHLWTPTFGVVGRAGGMTGRQRSGPNKGGGSTECLIHHGLTIIRLDQGQLKEFPPEIKFITFLLDVYLHTKMVHGDFSG